MNNLKPEFPLASDANNVYRQGREVFSFGRKENSPVTTVFIGLFQAIPYLEQIKLTIENQTQSNLHWLIVDNRSTDGTWKQVYEWAKESNHSITLARNGINLGGAGTMFVNLDLVETETLTFMHQDDVYSNKFVEKMLKGFSECTDAVVGFSDMGRISENGRSKGAFPSAAWALKDFDSISLFLANIRNHCVPWPALIVKTNFFGQCESPWYSTAFTDTETTLKMLSIGKFVHIPIEEMKYRENPRSESRSINSDDKDLGVAVSLTRVFNSSEFLKILDAVDINDRESFVIGLSEALHFRLRDSIFYTLVQTLAFEKIDIYWSHSSREVIERLQSLYDSVGAHRSAELLGTLSSLYTPKQKYEKSAELNETFQNDQVGPIEVNKNRVLIRGAGQKIYSVLAMYIPYKIRKWLWNIGFSTLNKANPDNPWNYKWR